MIVSKKIRDSARGEDCSLRMIGVCNFNSETTVLAHLPCGMKGVGMKSPDIMAVYACSSCHDVLDGRGKGDIDWRDILRALAETQCKFFEKGLLTIK